VDGEFDAYPIHDGAWIVCEYIDDWMVDPKELASGYVSRFTDSEWSARLNRLTTESTSDKNCLSFALQSDLSAFEVEIEQVRVSVEVSLADGLKIGMNKMEYCRIETLACAGWE